MAFLDETTILKEIKCEIINVDNDKESSGLLTLRRNDSEKKYLIELTFLNTGLQSKVK